MRRVSYSEGRVVQITTFNGASTVRIKAPDEVLFKWLVNAVKNRYKINVYIELTDERVLIVSDLPARFIGVLKARGFEVVEDFSESDFPVQLMVLGALAVFFLSLIWIFR